MLNKQNIFDVIYFLSLSTFSRNYIEFIIYDWMMWYVITGVRKNFTPQGPSSLAHGGETICV